ncbi:MAG TPA: helix-turn-helix domain-containing protein [Pseudolysinimonas sp.]|jgi:DNA-binding transcriptional ArsR family regulator|nr:helix-turn-helix domain-containing protein [Pseudolysinimonas sp.]
MAEETPFATYPTHGPALGTDELRALSHPLRLRILDELSMYGPLTASGLGERLGESSGSTSYHLRQLERVGLVAEKVGKGNARERWWERRAGSITFPDPADFPAGSADRLAARLLGEEALRAREQAFREFIAQDEDAIGEDWQRVSVVNTINLKLLPEQLHALVTEIDEVVARYIADYRATPSPGARPVQVQLNAFPLARGHEITDSGEAERSAE